MKNSPFVPIIKNSMNGKQVINNSPKEMNFKSGLSINKTSYIEFPSYFSNDL